MINKNLDTWLCNLYFSIELKDGIEDNYKEDLDPEKFVQDVGSENPNYNTQPDNMSNFQIPEDESMGLMDTSFNTTTTPFRTFLISKPLDNDNKELECHYVCIESASPE